MNVNINPLETSFSLGNKIQEKAILWNESDRHPVIGFMGSRVITIFIKPIARIGDVALYVIMATGKLAVGTFIVLPISTIAFLRAKDGPKTKLTIKNGLYDVAHAIVFFIDGFACIPLNFISPSLYKTRKAEVEAQNDVITDAETTINNLQGQLAQAQEDLNAARAAPVVPAVNLEDIQEQLRQAREDLEVARAAPVAHAVNLEDIQNVHRAAMDAFQRVHQEALDAKDRDHLEAKAQYERNMEEAQQTLLQVQGSCNTELNEFRTRIRQLEDSSSAKEDEFTITTQGIEELVAQNKNLLEVNRNLEKILSHQDTELRELKNQLTELKSNNLMSGFIPPTPPTLPPPEILVPFKQKEGSVKLAEQLENKKRGLKTNKKETVKTTREFVWKEDLSTLNLVQLSIIIPQKRNQIIEEMAAYILVNSQITKYDNGEARLDEVIELMRNLGNAKDLEIKKAREKAYSDLGDHDDLKAEEDSDSDFDWDDAVPRFKQNMFESFVDPSDQTTPEDTINSIRWYLDQKYKQILRSNEFINDHDPSYAKKVESKEKLNEHENQQIRSDREARESFEAATAIEKQYYDATLVEARNILWEKMSLAEKTNFTNGKLINGLTIETFKDQLCRHSVVDMLAVCGSKTKNAYSTAIQDSQVYKKYLNCGKYTAYGVEETVQDLNRLNQALGI